MSIVGWFSSEGPSGFGYNSTAEDVTADLDLTGRTYLLTGSNSGLGQETLRVLASRGARVIAIARDEHKAQAALAGLPGTPIACDLAEPASVRTAVRQIWNLPMLDGMIANAGIMALPQREVKHGLERQFLTNHVGHFLLITELLKRLTPTGRVVMVSSRAHQRTYPEGIRLDDLDASRGYTPWGAYGQSKLANLLFANELSKRLNPGQTANSLHPGVIATNLGRHLAGPLQLAIGALRPLVLKSIPQGAATQTWLATHPSLVDTTGRYFADCNATEPSEHGRDATLAAALWDRTEELLTTL